MRRCLLLLAANLATAGCNHLPRPNSTSTSAPTASPAASPAIVLASHSVSRPARHHEEDPAEIRHLTAGEAQELAIRSSAGAKLLELEPDTRRERSWFRKKAAPESESLHPFLLELAADDARNRDAGTALDLFYQLAGAELGRTQYQEIEAELAKLLEEARKAENAGLKIRADQEELATERTEAQVEIARFDATIAQLNAGLKLSLGLPIDARVRLIADDSLEITTQAIDIDEAVKIGLKRRSDLALLRTLSNDPDSEDARRLLSAANPMLADTVKAQLPAGVRFFVKLLTLCTGSWPGLDDSAATSDQIQALLAEKERQAEVEIRVAASKVEATAATARLQTALATQLRKRHADLQKEQAVGKAVVADLTRVQGALRKAEGAVLRARVEHLSALTKLRQAQGLLVREIHN